GFRGGVRKGEKDRAVRTRAVKNNPNAPLLRLTVDETWYDAGGGLVTGGKGIVNRLEPGEVAQVKIETPFNAKMKANNYNFSHANGTVKPHKVAKLTVGGDKEPAAKPASATKEKGAIASVGARRRDPQPPVRDTNRKRRASARFLFSSDVNRAASDLPDLLDPPARPTAPSRTGRPAPSPSGWRRCDTGR